MTAIFLVVLVLAWLVVFLPATRARHRAPLASTEQFKRELQTIALPRDSLSLAISFAPRRELNIRVARLALFLFMCGCVAVTFFALVVRGASVLDAQLTADAALLLYVAWLLEEKRKQPRRVVRVPSEARGAAEPPAVAPPVAVPREEATWWDVRILDDENVADDEDGVAEAAMLPDFDDDGELDIVLQEEHEEKQLA